MEILKNTTRAALKEFMGVEFEEVKKPLRRALSSSININDKHFVVMINKAFINKFCLDFLGESNPLSDNICDASKEIANLIIGKFKMSQRNSNDKKFSMKLGIPEFIGVKSIGKYKSAVHFNFNKLRCSIYEV